MKKLEFHPAASVFRLLEGAEFKALCESIADYGQQVSIKTLDGKVIDGRNRYRACLALKIDPWLENADLEGMTPVRYVAVMNRDRRHDSEAEQQLSAGRLKIALEQEAKERQHRGGLAPNGAKGKAAEVASENTGVPTRTVERAAKVVEHAAPEIVEAVEQGEVSVSDAAAVATLPKPKQKAALNKVKKGKAKTLRAAAEPHERNGKQKQDPRRFERSKSNLGKCRREIDDLNRDYPAFKFHRDTVASINAAIASIDDWRKAVK